MKDPNGGSCSIVSAYPQPTCSRYSGAMIYEMRIAHEKAWLVKERNLDVFKTIVRTFSFVVMYTLFSLYYALPEYVVHNLQEDRF